MNHLAPPSCVPCCTCPSHVSFTWYSYIIRGRSLVLLPHGTLLATAVALLFVAPFLIFVCPPLLPSLYWFVILPSVMDVIEPGLCREDLPPSLSPKHLLSLHVTHIYPSLVSWLGSF